MIWETDLVFSFPLMFGQNGKTTSLSNEVTKSGKMAVSLNSVWVLNS